jgi:hypothetical protein
MLVTLRQVQQSRIAVAAGWIERAIKEHSLDPLVIVEVLDVPNSALKNAF